MADNERNEPGATPAPPTSPGMTTPPPGPPPALPGEPGPPPATRPPTEITPDQIRQFQEFQRFQELMKDAAERGLPPGTPPPGLLQPWGPPPPKQSLPKRLLKAAASKIITGLVFLALLVAAGYFAIDYFFGPDTDQPTASQTGGKKAEGNLIYSTTPKEAVQKIYDDIAQGDAKSACGRFEAPARAQFTENMSEYGSTCGEIVETIHEAVVADGMKNEYANPWIPASAITPNSNPVSVSSCALEVTGGPRLGLFTLREIPNSKEQGGKRQWIVLAHAPEPADCGGTSSTPPTT